MTPTPDTNRARQPNLLVFWGFLAAGALVAVAFLLKFPNLLTNPANLALTTLTPIAIGLALGIQFSGLARRLPGLTVNGVRAVAAVLIALDLVVYAGPLFISGNAGKDTTPAFVSTATTVPSTGATATTAPAATTLSGVFDHRAGVDTVAGNATLGKTSDGKVILRFENLNSANGPDLHVYLSKQASPATTQQVMDGVEVGKLKATTGASNYELAATTDITQFKSVVIYCKSFSVVFGYANLT
ncbi:MAG TPA: DM13 domain-containing protein [Ktedonobacterales bacterium]|jgi:electron transfer DM13|nr:DM13 domain-containing protein [Ktedonobacterales bacterium]